MAVAACPNKMPHAAILQLPAECIRAMAARIGENIGYVSKLRLDIVFVAQNVVHLHSGDACSEGVDGQFSFVEVEDVGAIYKLFGEGVIIADFVYFSARIPCVFNDPLKSFLSS